MHDHLPFEIRRFWTDPTVTDILVNEGVHVWIERDGHLERGPDLRPGDIDSALQRILVPLGRRLDRLTPMVDARLTDGTRVCAVIEPVAVGGTCAAFRLFRRHAFTLEDFAPPHAGESWSSLRETLHTSRTNILITGPTGSGKSALLSALASTSRVSERLVVIEDTYELVIDHVDVVRLECRNATHEGRGEIGLDGLLRTALRLRPDRLVVGEVRGPEALTLVQAMSTGHQGCLATLHANSAIEGLHRLDVLTLCATQGWNIDDVRTLVNASIGLVVHMCRTSDGRRSIAEVAAVHPNSRERHILVRFEA